MSSPALSLLKRGIDIRAEPSRHGGRRPDGLRCSAGHPPLDPGPALLLATFWGGVSVEGRTARSFPIRQLVEELVYGDIKRLTVVINVLVVEEVNEAIR